MSFHVNISLLQDNWGMEIAECSVITEAGEECLADMPRNLLVKD